MIDARTALLVGAAIASPWLLQAGSTAGLPIPVYITAGQRAALAAIPATVCGVSTMPVGGELADTSSVYAKWSRINQGLLARNGAGAYNLYANAAWNPTQFAKMSPAEAREFAQAIKAAADAGAGVVSGSGEYESYSDGGRAGVANGGISDTSAYQDLNGLLATDSTWGSDDDDAKDFAPAILALALECDNRGYLQWGKPFVPTVTGGIDAAGSAVVDFVGGVAGSAAGTLAGLAAGAVLSTPGLMLIGGLVLFKAFR